jgi:hypothetical protein
MKKDLEKQKLINLIIQGEAKNVKLVFNAPDVQDGLKEILGEDKGERAIQALRNLTKNADKKDWLIDLNTSRGFITNQGMPAAGLVSIEWE